MSFKRYFEVGPVFSYFFRKKDPNAKASFSTKAMHGVNKLSMLMFLIAALVILYRLFLR